MGVMTWDSAEELWGNTEAYDRRMRLLFFNLFQGTVLLYWFYSALVCVWCKQNKISLFKANIQCILYLLLPAAIKKASYVDDSLGSRPHTYTFGHIAQHRLKQRGIIFSTFISTQPIDILHSSEQPIVLELFTTYSHGLKGPSISQWTISEMNR